MLSSIQRSPIPQPTDVNTRFPTATRTNAQSKVAPIEDKVQLSATAQLRAYAEKGELQNDRDDRG